MTAQPAEPERQHNLILPDDAPPGFFDDQLTPEIFAAEVERHRVWVAAGRPGAMTGAEARRRLLGDK
jgi:hypothetical protein